MICCPAHDDRHPSLTVSLGRGGRILLKCHAGCSVENIVAAWGLALRDLMPESDGDLRGSSQKRPTVVQTTRYPIRDVAGNEVAVHIREDLSDGSKRFRWERDEKPGLAGLAVADLPLYKAEKVNGWSPGIPIILVEGEKAADALAVRGFHALATVTGASGTPSVEPLAVLHGRDVIVWPDNDAIGRKHMTRIAQMLHGKAARVRMLGWGKADGDDAVDFFTKGGTKEGLRELGRGTADWTPTAAAEVEDETRPGAITVRLSDVKAEAVTWLWNGRIPLGKLTILDGDPDLGKSTLLLDLAARVTRGGPMPGDGATISEARNVVILSAEDGASDTIRPRFDEAGGDPERVHLLTAIRRADGTKDFFSLSDDIDALEEMMVKFDAALVIIDPFTAYVGKANTWKDQEIRRVLARLADAAGRTGAAIVLLRHLNKTRSDNALYRGGGSVGIIGAARSGLLAAKDPDAPEEKRLLATYKHNLCPQPPTLAYRLVAGKQRPDVGTIEWLGTDSRMAQEILADGADGPEGRGAIAEATEFLEQELGDGPRCSSEVDIAARANGISDRTLARAKKRTGVKAEREGFGKGGRWMLRLPHDDQRVPNSSKGANKNDGTLRDGVAPYGSASPSSGTACAFHIGAMTAACERCGRPFADHAGRVGAEPPWEAQGTL
jgi:hypothetical protein